MNLDVLVRNHVNVFGKGKQTVIFANGFGCDQTMWRFITPYFDESDYRIVQFDYVGSGKSDLSAYQDEKYKTLQGYAQDLLDVCEALQIKDAVFVGHSVSSMIGALASIQHSEFFKCLIMIGPSPRYLNDEGYFGGFEKKDIDALLTTMEMNFVGWASSFAPIVMMNEHKVELSQELENTFRSNIPRIARQFAEATFYSDHRGDLPKVTVPSLILQCSEDSVVPLEAAMYLKQHLKDSTLQVMQASGHYPHVSHPEETVYFIKDYIARL